MLLFSLWIELVVCHLECSVTVRGDTSQVVDRAHVIRLLLMKGNGVECVVTSAREESSSDRC